MSITGTLAKLDFIGRIEGWISTFGRADWHRAGKRGVAGIAGEIGRCLTRSNSPAIHLRRNAGWTGVEVERLLAGYGVRIFDRAFTGDTLCFRVTERQHEWADYLLRRAGVPVVTPPAGESNAHAGTIPAPWSRQSEQDPDLHAEDDLTDRFLALFDTPSQHARRRHAEPELE
jgi:hypothetical protein